MCACIIEVFGAFGRALGRWVVPRGEERAKYAITVRRGIGVRGMALCHFAGSWENGAASN